MINRIHDSFDIDFETAERLALAVLTNKVRKQHKGGDDRMSKSAAYVLGKDPEDITPQERAYFKQLYGMAYYGTSPNFVHDI